LVVAVVVPPANVPLAPVCAGAANITVTPLTGLLPTSLTSAINGDPNAVLMLAVCPDPLDTVIEAGDPGWLVNEKLADVETPDTDAVTVYVPAVELAVGSADACPSPFVEVLIVLVPLLKVALATAPDGDVKVTVALARLP
jgi:hypothetical protein